LSLNRSFAYVIKTTFVVLPRTGTAKGKLALEVKKYMEIYDWMMRKENQIITKTQRILGAHF